MDELLNIGAILLLGIVALSVVYSLLTAAISIFQLLRRNKPDKLFQPPVSILKPLKGMDDRLEDNLRSFFLLDYPRYQLLFGVMDDDDPAIEVVGHLQREYPHIDSRLVVNSRKAGLNPKISNLSNIFPFAKHDFILISDSNIRADKDYLSAMVAHMKNPDVGLVTSIIRGKGARRMGAVLENLHLNSYIVGNVIAVQKLFRRPVTIGKSMLFRKETVLNIGGFSCFKNFLAEDHLIGARIQELGLRVNLSYDFVDNINEKWSLGKFINRHLRWAKMRRHLNLAHYAAEIISNPISLAFLYGLCHPDSLGALIFAVVTVMKMSGDLAVARAMRSDLKPVQFLLIPLKDLTIGIIWAIPFFSRRISWRGNRFRITNQTALQSID
jgi:ceramide glucosyltransferase